MVLPPKLLKVYREECNFYSSTVSRIDQKILNEFIREGYFERYLNKNRKCYREKHDLLLQELKAFDEKFYVTGEHAGLHLLLHCRSDEVSEKELVERAKKAGVKVYSFLDVMIQQQAMENDFDKNDFKASLQNDTHPILILGYGGLTKEEIKEGLDRLKEAWL